MQKIPNYATLWQEIFQARQTNADPQEKEQHWRENAQKFFQRVQSRWQTPDSTRDLLLSTVQSIPNCTLTDIGSGPGNFSLFIAPHCAHVTAIDPSPSMLSVFKQQIEQHAVPNITLHNTTWATAPIPPKSTHITFSSHAIYGDPDLIGFLQKMNQVTTHRCFLLVRAPFPHSIMSQAAQLVWGQPHDSPNFQIIYNTLLQLGIIANVTPETPNGWKPVFSDSISDALQKIKTRLNITQTKYDLALKDILTKELLPTPDGRYQWPQWGESALIHWKPPQKSPQSSNPSP